MMDWLDLGVVRCIGCGCDDFNACFDDNTGGPCSWLETDVSEGLGVCSACPGDLARFLQGDRHFAVPVEPVIPETTVDYCFWCPNCEEPEGVCSCDAQ